MVVAAACRLAGSMAVARLETGRLLRCLVNGHFSQEFCDLDYGGESCGGVAFLVCNAHAPRISGAPKPPGKSLYVSRIFPANRRA
jgi:hypothetical protein